MILLVWGCVKEEVGWGRWRSRLEALTFRGFEADETTGGNGGIFDGVFSVVMRTARTAGVLVDRPEAWEF